MKAVIVGGGGQLGRSLQLTAPAGVAVSSLDRSALDITDVQAVKAAVQNEKPDVIFNAAAYTAVDKAESDAEAATAANATAVGVLAEAAREAGASFVHVSTDFVFDGAAGTPYPTDAPTAPLGVYGATKLAGELLAGPDALIIRTAWVYAPTGGNFVRTMLRLMGERPEVRVVADQIGTPTYAPSLAKALWTMANAGGKGMYHYTDSGVASWYDFAVAIQEIAIEIGLLESKVPVIPITTNDFPTPAKRPSYSVLDKSSTYALIGEIAPHWRDNLRIMLKEIKSHG